MQGLVGDAAYFIPLRGLGRALLNVAKQGQNAGMNVGQASTRARDVHVMYLADLEPGPGGPVQDWSPAPPQSPGVTVFASFNDRACRPGNSAPPTRSDRARRR